MKDSISDRDIQPLDPADILLCVRDAMNLSNLNWLLNDEKRRAQWFADLEHQSDEAAQASADSEAAAPVDKDDLKKPPSTKRPPRVASVESIQTIDVQQSANPGL